MRLSDDRLEFNALPPRPRLDHYPVLDALRGVAAICVTVMHIGYALQLHHSVFHSYMAVPFFFVLSGFVIGERYEARLAAGETTLNFMTTRLIRLYPLVLAGIAIYAVTSAAPIGSRAYWSAMALAMIPYMVSGNVFPANPPMWSLFLELTGNLTHALSFRALSNRVLGGLLFGLGLAVTAVGVTHGTLQLGPTAPTLVSGGLVFAFSYLAGVMLARFHAPQAITWRVPAALVIGALTLLLVTPGPMHGPFNATRDIFCVVVAFPTIVALGGTSTVGTAGRRACDLLGKLSYPLYVINHPVLDFIAPLTGFEHQRVWVRYALSPALLLFLLALSWVVLRFFDEPTRAWLSKRRRTKRLRSAAVPQEGAAL